MNNDDITILIADVIIKAVTWNPSYYWVDEILSWNPCNHWERRPVIKRQAVTFEQAVCAYTDILVRSLE